MGIIKKDIVDIFLAKYPEQEVLLKPFLTGFDVTYANRFQINNTILFGYMLKPEDFMKDAFGLKQELLLVYSQYDIFEPRALQATNMLFSTFPFINRIDIIFTR